MVKVVWNLRRTLVNFWHIDISMGLSEMIRSSNTEVRVMTDTWSIYPRVIMNLNWMRSFDSCSILRRLSVEFLSFEFWNYLCFIFICVRVLIKIVLIISLTFVELVLEKVIFILFELLFVRWCITYSTHTVVWLREKVWWVVKFNIKCRVEAIITLVILIKQIWASII